MKFVFVPVSFLVLGDIDFFGEKRRCGDLVFCLLLVALGFCSNYLRKLDSYIQFGSKSGTASLGLGIGA